MKHCIKSCLSVCATIALMLGIAGCCSTTTKTTPAVEGQYAPEGYEAVANCEVSNCGYYLFNRFPLVTGSITRPNTMDYKYFRNTVNEDANLVMMKKTLQKQKIKSDALGNLHSESDSYGYFSLWLVWLRHTQTSAVVLKKNKTAVSGAGAGDAGVGMRETRSK